MIHYKTITVKGLKIFYREAGNIKAPTLLLLHGFPTSSHMFRNLIPLLAGSITLLLLIFQALVFQMRLEGPSTNILLIISRKQSGLLLKLLD